jgi:hypothetical protein
VGGSLLFLRKRKKTRGTDIKRVAKGLRPNYRVAVGSFQ